MRRVRVFLLRLFGSLDGRRTQEEVSRELKSHLQLHIEHNLGLGMTPEEARRDALVRLGGLEQARQLYIDQRGLPSMEDFFRDIRLGARVLWKNAGFSLVVVLTLALGIGANTAIFSIVNAVLLKSLPFDSPRRLVVIHEAIPVMGYSKMGVSPPDFTIFAREQKSFEAVAAFQNKQMDVSGTGEPERITVARVSASLFRMLGQQPLFGRVFAPEEDAAGHPLAILSYGLWQRRYGSASNIMGQTIQLDQQPYTVIGVMPSHFTFPLRGPENNGTPADVWVPIGFTPVELQAWGTSYLSTVIGRLRPGVTITQAQQEADSLSHAILSGYPPFLANALHGGLAFNMIPFQDEVVGAVRPLLLILTAAVGFVLLIACANVATLLLSRAARRQKEVAVRIAVGATRLALVRQMMTESLLLALSGGALGLGLALWGRDLIVALAPQSVSLPEHVPLDGAVLTFTLLITLIAAILFGIVPAFHTLDTPVRSALQESGRGTMDSATRHRLQNLFVVVEFALAMVLLIGSGLLTRSLTKLFTTDTGFRPDHVLTLSVPLPRAAYPQAAQVMDFYERLVERAASLPGVRTAGLSSDLPLNAREMVSMTVEGQENVNRDTPQAICQSWVLGDYFKTMGIRLLQGRWFNDADRAQSQPVAVVSLSLARRYWHDEQDAIGKRIRWGAADPWETVIGVVGDVNQSTLSTPVAPHLYRPYAQLPGPLLDIDPFGDWHAMNLVLRTEVDPGSLASSAVASVQSLDGDLAVADIRTMASILGSSLAAPEFSTVLLSIFAGLAVFLAAIGIYGVLSYQVAQRTHEIGVRMAMGAQQGQVLGMILRRGTVLAAVGIAIGFPAAMGTTHLLSSLLFGISAMDSRTFVVVPLLLIAVAVAACWIPARRAVRVDPMIALRYE